MELPAVKRYSCEHAEWFHSLYPHPLWKVREVLPELRAKEPKVAAV